MEALRKRLRQKRARTEITFRIRLDCLRRSAIPRRRTLPRASCGPSRLIVRKFRHIHKVNAPLFVSSFFRNTQQAVLCIYLFDCGKILIFASHLQVGRASVQLCVNAPMLRYLTYSSERRRSSQNTGRASYQAVVWRLCVSTRDGKSSL